jgi:hypothetical protein
MVRFLLMLAGSLIIPTTPAAAEVFCFAKTFLINGYVHGMPALENITLVDGSFMPNVSLCATNCSDAATSQRLAIALTAQARGLPLQIYFGTVNSCTAITAYDKAYGLRIAP